MDTKIMKVVQQGEVQFVNSQKAEGGTIARCNIVLQEIGGRYEDSFVATMLGNLAQCSFYQGDVVAVKLRFQTREYQGQSFQDIVVSDIVKMSHN